MKKKKNVGKIIQDNNLIIEIKFKPSLKRINKKFPLKIAIKTQNKETQKYHFL